MAGLYPKSTNQLQTVFNPRWRSRRDLPEFDGSFNGKIEHCRPIVVASSSLATESLAEDRSTAISAVAGKCDLQETDGIADRQVNGGSVASKGGRGVTLTGQSAVEGAATRDKSPRLGDTCSFCCDCGYGFAACGEEMCEGSSAASVVQGRGRNTDLTHAHTTGYLFYNIRV